ncbi:MAG: class I SAM-dependent methyltransferase, partial [Actinomycetia bacterium]|nr:class I SAM-dependent methyltransferase [Actinomycetes bacterium]
MELADIALLTGPEGRQLLADLPPYDERAALAIGERLRRAGHSPDLVAAALTQSRLRTRAAHRWGSAGADLLPRLLLTPDGAEQATRPTVAALRAERYRRLGRDQAVADLGCGVGIDALALADAGLRVDAYDLDPVTAAVAVANAAATGHGEQINVTSADVTRMSAVATAQYDAAFADPARRRAGRRLLRPETWSPPLSWVLDLPIVSLGVKVAPGLPHQRVRSETEFAVVSDGGDVVEAALYRGALRQVGVTRSAMLLPARDHVSDADLPATPPPINPVGQYLHEPDGAVIRAGLVAAVVDAVDGWLIDPHIAYVSSNSDATSPFLSSYQIVDVLPFGLKRLRAYLRAEGVGHVVVKKRGSAIDVD